MTEERDRRASQQSVTEERHGSVTIISFDYELPQHLFTFFMMRMKRLGPKRFAYVVFFKDLEYS